MLKSKPKLKDLSYLVTRNYAAKWKVIGLLLGLTQPQLDIIDNDHGRSAVKSCNEMWGKWLATHINATWEEVLNSLEHRNVAERDNIDLDYHIKKGMFCCANIFVACYYNLCSFQLIELIHIIIYVCTYIDNFNTY